MDSVTVRRVEAINIDTMIAGLKNNSVLVGWFPSARYDDKDSTPVAAVAAQNEFGNPNKNVPARPFIRPAISRNERKWKNIARHGVKALLANKTTVNTVLENMGEIIVGDIQHSISLVFTPPLKQSTIEARIARRSHSGRLNKTQAQSTVKPLIDTGHMQATVSYELESNV